MKTLENLDMSYLLSDSDQAINIATGQFDSIVSKFQSEIDQLNFKIEQQQSQN